ncbi:hypothetical protein I8U26_09690 [Thermoactinomyces sp. CICC 10520]|nr:hypothetical protein [Thermoactinomyces sp. CICC 10520]MBH8586484.1 hypothetical protein [Thermoactinomyces sp. CICC 10520]
MARKKQGCPNWRAGVIWSLGRRKSGIRITCVLKFVLEDDSWVAARPSGTEPKLKFYFGVKDTGMENCERKMERFKQHLFLRVREAIQQTTA